MKAPIIKAWKRGDKLTAVRLDQPRVAFEQLLNRLGAVGKGGPGSGVRLMQMQVVTIESDSLTCSLYDADGAVEGSVILVAKPYLLRNSLAARGSATYVYSAIDTRVSTVSAVDEDQVVTPPYIAGDLIYALSTPIGGTGVTTTVAGEEVSISWLDNNNDARAWAEA